MYKLIRRTAHGIFSLRLYRDPSLEEMNELSTLAFNLTEPPKDASSVDLESAIRENLKLSSGQLGSKPKTAIMMGSYKEPETGVSFQMLDYPKGNVIPVIKKLALIAPISATGWGHILRGNFTEIKFLPEVAMKIHSVLREHEIYANIINSDEDNSSGEIQAIQGA